MPSSPLNQQAQPAAGTPPSLLPPRPRQQRPTLSGVLAEAIGADEAGEPGPGTAVGGQVPLTGVTLRAQAVRGGDLFAALPGARVHGAAFAAQAIASGAAAILTDAEGARQAEQAGVGPSAGVPVLLHSQPRAVLGRVAALVYGEPSRTLRIIGITGTAGKTTTAYLVEAALRAAGRTTGLVGTVETLLAGERLDSAFTTPEAPDLQALLALMVERGVTDVVMEVSSHALALGRVGGTRFAVGAFTNLSQEHLDFHRDMEDYFQAKAMLFDGRAEEHVVCVDTEWGQRLAATAGPAITVSGDAQACHSDWSPSEQAPSDVGGQSFVAQGPGGLRIPVRLRLPGPFNVTNALLAAACSYAADVPTAAIAGGFSQVNVPGRMEQVTQGQHFTALIDYSHKPVAVAAVLQAVRAQYPGKVILVLGCGGDRDRAKRPMMGRTAAELADVLVVTDDNPRTEDPAEIRAEMLGGALQLPSTERADVLEIGDRAAAIREAVARARPGDCVVVAGKGHERGQEIDGVKHPFSDREVLAEAIGALAGSRDHDENPPATAPWQEAAR